MPESMVDQIINVFYDRKGFDDWWDSMDPRDRDEIYEKIQYIIG